jgi:hypothetical protein
MKVDTKCIHAGEPEPRIHGAAVMPIFQVCLAVTFDGDAGTGAPPRCPVNQR